MQEIINEMQEKYDTEYFPKQNVLLIRGKVDINDFIIIKAIVKKINEQTEIIVGDRVWK